LQWVASGFLFVRGNTFIHKLDPRARLWLTGAIFIVSLLSHIVELLTIIGIVALLITGSKTLRRFSRSMIFALIISAFTFLLDRFIFPVPGGSVAAAVYALRLFAIIASSSLFFLTTTPDELEHVMRWLRLPPDFIMVFVIAVRFVPVLLLDALQIMDAQKSRGLEFERGSLIGRMRNAIPLLVPLIAVAVNRSLDLAEAMDSRAYGATAKPTSLYVLRFSDSDYLVSIFVGIGFAIGIFSAFFLHLI
jgi:energy-coupling factor transport system permease protein